MMVCSQMNFFGYCLVYSSTDGCKIPSECLLGHQSSAMLLNDSRFCSTACLGKAVTFLHLEHKTNKIHLHLIAHCFFFTTSCVMQSWKLQITFLWISTILVSKQGPYYSSLVYMHSVSCNDHQRKKLLHWQMLVTKIGNVLMKSSWLILLSLAIAYNLSSMSYKCN